MEEKKKSLAEKKFFEETKYSLSSKIDNIVLAKLRELKSSGNVSILPLILDLIADSKSEIVRSEVLSFISDLKDEKSVPVIINYIDNNKCGEHLSELIASCWQSRLNYSKYLISFARCFVNGEYQTALESFTVIEETLWQSSVKAIEDCKKYLMDRIDEIGQIKKPLYKELIKILEEGKSKN
ncbi:MAG: hypothetical protein JW894_05675 [Bacteroidales bacterium]|nr:hypothetical protein [Bacteroidales bacterium]